MPATKIILCFALSIFGLRLSAAERWPQFRGPNGDGIADSNSCPTQWDEKTNVAWKTSLPGRGWSSPVIADGQIWLTTALESVPEGDERLSALQRLGEDPKHYKQKHVASEIELKLLQIDLKTGQLVQERSLVQLETPDAIHIVNSYASPTPVLDDNHIYCHFGTYGTICINRKSGTEVWRRQISLEHSVGPGSSPFVYKDLLVLICDGVDRQYVVAFNKHTGETLWETDRPEMDAPDGDRKKAFDTPIAVQDAQGREQLICMGSQWLVSYAPKTGEEIWKVYHGKGFSVVPRPVYDEGIVYISTGFGKPELWAVRVDGSGDVSDTHVLWTVPKGIPAKPSPLLLGENLYVISDDGIATCFSRSDGSEIWKKRIGGKFSASPTYADGHIYLCGEDGKTTVFKPGTEFEMVAENQLDGRLMASPAVTDDSLILRTDSSLYRIMDSTAR